MGLDNAPDSKIRFQAVNRFFLLLAAVSAGLVLGAYGWKGVDFSSGVLLGCLIVAINTLWTKSILSTGWKARRFRLRLSLSYGIRFGLTALVLFQAIVHYNQNPYGIMVGLGGLPLSAVIFVLAGSKQKKL
ncbi:MAG: ATP synthase subunit I [Deltaproteobacteria bacterium]|nr:ATP synthase subunit I [Deltaproteobacteria bacterium]